MRATVLLVAFLAWALPVAAAPITIDFEDLRINSALAFSVGNTYSSNGFTLAGIPFPGSSSTGELDFFGTLSTSFSGSTGLFNCCAQDSVRLTRTDGGVFSLLSIDIVETPNFNNDGSTLDVGLGHMTFIGAKRNGKTVSYTTTFLQFPTINEIDFKEFTDLLSVSWQQGPGGVPGPTHQFDNITLQAVPEPATLVLLGIGCGGITVLRGRLRRRDVAKT